MRSISGGNHKQIVQICTCIPGFLEHYTKDVCLKNYARIYIISITHPGLKVAFSVKYNNLICLYAHLVVMC